MLPSEYAPHAEAVSYGAVICEGELVAEASTLDAHATPTLRAAVLSAARSTRRRKSRFFSRGARGARGVHVLSMHGHCFAACASSADVAAPFCAQLCDAFASMGIDSTDYPLPPLPPANPPAHREGAVAPARVAEGESHGALLLASDFSTRFSLRLRQLLDEHATQVSQVSTQVSTQVSSQVSTGRRRMGEAPHESAVERSVDEVEWEPREVLRRHERRREDIRAVRREVEEVSEEMQVNVAHMLASCAKLEVLDERAEWLLARAEAFRRRAAVARRRNCCRNCKTNACLAVPLLFVGFGALLMILNYVGMIALDWLDWRPFGRDHPPPIPPPPPPIIALEAYASRVWASHAR